MKKMLFQLLVLILAAGCAIAMAQHCRARLQEKAIWIDYFPHNPVSDYYAA